MEYISPNLQKLKRRTIAAIGVLAMGFVGLGSVAYHAYMHRTKAEITFSDYGEIRRVYYTIKDIDGIREVKFEAAGKTVYSISPPAEKPENLVGGGAGPSPTVVAIPLPPEDWSWQGDLPIEISGSVDFRGEEERVDFIEVRDTCGHLVGVSPMRVEEK